MAKKWIVRIIFIITVSILFIMSFSYYWAVREFSGVDFATMVFQLSVPLKGTSSDILNDYKRMALIPSIICIMITLLISSIYWLTNTYDFSIHFSFNENKMRYRLARIKIPLAIILMVIVIWGEVVWIYADRAFGMKNYIKSQVEESHFIEEEYVSPKDVAITFPKKKRNLIWILMESAESSSQGKEDGGLQVVNYIPEMTQIAKDNISFSQSDPIEGASVTPGNGWTIAGIIGQSAGIPLKLPVGGNSMGQYDTFMPNLSGLGDILKKEGYHNLFMCGSDLEFAGRSNYFLEHGDYETFDYYSAIKEGKISSDYRVWWGFEDQKLYSYAKEKLKSLAKKDEPFNLTMLTVDTHYPDGYVCDICPNKYDSQYGNVWACASNQVNEFLSWIKKQDFYEDTTIVISGDHLTMDGNFFKGLDSKGSDGSGTERKVYNAFINSAKEPKKEKMRQFTTLDLFPSIVSSLGADIEGGRLGLGTDLFSDRQTLSEKYGYEYLFAELEKKSSFYNKNILY